VQWDCARIEGVGRSCCGISPNVAELGSKAASKAVETAQAGAALVTSAPSHIVNPKLALHLDLIVKGLDQSVRLVKDTGVMLAEIVA
jgi:hypothetical protein